MKVIVHGGAGGSPDDPGARRAVLDDAAETGAEAPTPLAAVEAALRRLESSPRFNAGVGSAVQSDGAIRTDAGTMTSDRRVGAACSMAGVEHPVSAARVVLEETPHVLVSGDHAVELAADYGISTGRDLWTDRNRRRWADADPPSGRPRDHLAWLSDRFGGANKSDQQDDRNHDHDTVGAVARQDGEFAAATSTGGRWFALAGRVGDVPQVGSGFYCSSAGGASATGDGEDIARVTLSRRAVSYLEAGHTADEAARLALREFEDHAGENASAGVIVLGSDGDGTAYDSDSMQTATGER
jgi:beta-aspartyl-peptidase (threonine type)